MLLFPSPGDLPNPGIEPRCPALHADALLSEPPEKPKGSAKCIPKSLQKKSLRCTENQESEQKRRKKKEEEEKARKKGKRKGRMLL